MFRPIADLAASGELSFTFDGQPMTARAGDTVAAALLVNGITACRETPVSDTPRAPYCLMGVCFECLMEIDGIANRQACLVPIEPGMRVTTGAGRGKVQP